MPARASNARRKEHVSRSYRFDARLNESQKLLIQHAADLEGRTLTEFVLRSAEKAAERTIQERSILVLSAKQSEIFVQALLAPAPEPGPTLRKAAKRYKKRLGL